MWTTKLIQQIVDFVYRCVQYLETQIKNVLFDQIKNVYIIIFLLQTNLTYYRVMVNKAKGTLAPERGWKYHITQGPHPPTGPTHGAHPPPGEFLAEGYRYLGTIN